ncbi:hypothetical protein EC912_108124 [Luteibacter rhizovicinus]|uniref:Inovirus Gp2 family protein n=1 Tax=Luteibacter rhizovicinus TaxID=242606 RepID=A0A4R3YIV7_9GAMM|nr:hypothetical protein [Luteibacter rhizovicinus]TCV92130.1 hypothetical protein EC912_108124 [Luteibacter rhizovicinus]
MSEEVTRTTQTTLQTALGNWLQGAEPNAFITYSFRRAVSYDMACKTFGSHAYKLKCHFFGRNSKRRLAMIPVIEKYYAGKSYGALETDSEGIHIHCLIHLPEQPKDHMELIRETWISANPACGDPLVYCPNSDEWFKEIRTDDTANILINYALKTCTRDTESVLWKFVSLGQ